MTFIRLNSMDLITLNSEIFIHTSISNVPVVSGAGNSAINSFYPFIYWIHKILAIVINHYNDNNNNHFYYYKIS